MEDSIAKHSNAYKYWQNLLSDDGFLIISKNATEHDKLMQHIQVAIHILYFSYAQYLINQKVSLNDLIPILTPIAKAFLGSLCHTMMQTKDTYNNIQQQLGAKETRRKVKEALTQTSEIFSSGDGVDYLERMSKAMQISDSKANKAMRLIFKKLNLY